jgi:hypothetical protein
LHNASIACETHGKFQASHDPRLATKSKLAAHKR